MNNNNDIPKVFHMTWEKYVLYISIKTRCIRKKHARLSGMFSGGEVVQQFRTVFYNYFAACPQSFSMHYFFSFISILKSIDIQNEKVKHFKWA